MCRDPRGLPCRRPGFQNIPSHRDDNIYDDCGDTSTHSAHKISLDITKEAKRRNDSRNSTGGETADPGAGGETADPGTGGETADPGTADPGAGGTAEDPGTTTPDTQPSGGETTDPGTGGGETAPAPDEGFVIVS